MIVPNSDLLISNSTWTVGTYINGREIQFLKFTPRIAGSEKK
jgi:hypothetical protein